MTPTTLPTSPDPRPEFLVQEVWCLVAKSSPLAIVEHERDSPAFGKVRFVPLFTDGDLAQRHADVLQGEGISASLFPWKELDQIAFLFRLMERSGCQFVAYDMSETHISISPIRDHLRAVEHIKAGMPFVQVRTLRIK